MFSTRSDVGSKRTLEQANEDGVSKRAKALALAPTAQIISTSVLVSKAAGNTLRVRIQGPLPPAPPNGVHSNAAPRNAHLSDLTAASFHPEGLRSASWSSSAAGSTAELHLEAKLVDRCGVLRQMVCGATVVPPACAPIAASRKESEGSNHEKDDEEAGEGVWTWRVVQLGTGCSAWRLIDVLLLLMRPDSWSNAAIDAGLDIVEAAQMADFLGAEEAVDSAMKHIISLARAAIHRSSVVFSARDRRTLLTLEALPVELQLNIVKEIKLLPTLALRPAIFFTWCQQLEIIDLTAHSLDTVHLQRMAASFKMLPRAREFHFRLHADCCDLDAVASVTQFLPHLETLGVHESRHVLTVASQKAWSTLFAIVSSTLRHVVLSGTLSHAPKLDGSAWSDDRGNPFAVAAPAAFHSAPTPPPPVHGGNVFGPVVFGQQRGFCFSAGSAQPESPDAAGLTWFIELLESCQALKKITVNKARGVVDCRRYFQGRDITVVALQAQ